MTTSQTNQKSEISDSETNGKQCLVQGIPVHYVENGDGIPVLAIHGAYSAHQEVAACLEPIFDEQSDYRRIYIDLPGMGRTPAPETVQSLDDVLDIVEGFIDNVIGDTPFLLVAHSYGGYLAQAIANRRLAQVSGLVLLCPVVAMGENAGQQVPDHLVLHRSDDGSATLNPDNLAEFQNYFVIQNTEMVKRYQEAVEPGVALADGAALERIFGKWKLSDASKVAPPYLKPTLILVGRQDSTVGYADQWQLVEQYPRATFAVLDRAGHALPHEQPELLRALLGEWLARVAEFHSQAGEQDGG